MWQLQQHSKTNKFGQVNRCERPEIKCKSPVERTSNIIMLIVVVSRHTAEGRIRSPSCDLKWLTVVSAQAAERE